MPERVQSVERSIDILSTLVDGPKTVTEVARATKLSKPTAFRLLGSLRYRNLVTKDDETNAYMLGAGWLRMLDASAASFQSIGVLARDPLHALTGTTGETSVVHVRIGRERVCVAEAPSANPVRYTISVGSVAPLHVGASGKVLLAFSEEGERRRLLESLPLAAVTEATVTEPSALARQMDEIRLQGYAVSFGERTPGAAGVTVPVQASGGFLAALSVVGPAERFVPARVDFFVAALRVTAAAIESILGHD